ncbi:hypothetical protein ZIOFF_013921 [Zingiber officinale]|uniref:Uncharacterized protein n=1 Tax=Zingiber officinale TaxID=94328 RepID=A0A8J5HAU3_ZINOF|nr:hypothetical protein ZIOFF_013921 [Zingiber officinale]
MCRLGTRHHGHGHGHGLLYRSHLWCPSESCHHHCLCDMKEVLTYVVTQLVGATLTSGTVCLMFGGQHEHFLGTIPTGSDVQSLVLEFIISFYLMFVIFRVATNNRAIGELAGLAVGATILVNVLLAGYAYIEGIDEFRKDPWPAIMENGRTGISVYIVGSVCRTIAGAWEYSLIRFTNKPLFRDH